jgi:hypothetical protein
MFDTRATPASRIRAARELLEMVLHGIESESRRPKRQTAHRCADLLIAAVEKTRARVCKWHADIEREDELRKSMGQPPLTENEKREQFRALEAQECEDALNETDPPEDAQSGWRQPITEYACAALGVLRRAMWDSHASPPSRTAAARVLFDASQRMREMERRKAADSAVVANGDLTMQQVEEARARVRRPIDLAHDQETGTQDFTETETACL